MCESIKARLEDAPLYLRSSVTAVPPFGLPASVSSWVTWSAAAAPAGRTDPASWARRARMARMERSCVGMSKYSSWCLKS